MLLWNTGVSSRPSSTCTHRDPTAEFPAVPTAAVASGPALRAGNWPAAVCRPSLPFPEGSRSRVPLSSVPRSRVRSGGETETVGVHPNLRRIPAAFGPGVTGRVVLPAVSHLRRLFPASHRGRPPRVPGEWPLRFGGATGPCLQPPPAHWRASVGAARARPAPRGGRPQRGPSQRQGERLPSAGRRAVGRRNARARAGLEP